MRNRRNRRIAAVRLFLHDLVCTSRCSPADAFDHARRTQHKAAARLVDSYDAADPRAARWMRDLHDSRCPAHGRGGTCDNLGEHRQQIADSDAAANLRATIEAA